MLGEHLRQRRAYAGHDVHDASRNIRGFQHGVEVRRAQGVALGGNGDHGIAHRDGGRDERDKAEQRALVGADQAYDADWLVRRQRHAAHRRGMNRAVVLVGPGAVGEEPLDARLHLARRVIAPAASHAEYALSELFGAGRKVLCKVVENLRAQVSGSAGPAAGRVRRLDGVADVLAVALADLAEVVAARAEDGSAVAAVGSRLLAADEELGRAVERGPPSDVVWRGVSVRAMSVGIVAVGGKL